MMEERASQPGVKPSAPREVCLECRAAMGKASSSTSKPTPSSLPSPSKGATDFEAYQLKVLCFNVFTGSPLPFYWATSPSLEDSERLRLQVDHIRRLGPDIICLQEVCSDGVERYYRTALADHYDGYCEHYCHPMGRFTKYMLYALLSAILFWAVRVVIQVVGLWDGGDLPFHWSLPYLVHALLILKSFIFVFVLMRKSAVTAFLGGKVLTSNLILWKRDRFLTRIRQGPDVPLGAQGQGGGGKVMHGFTHLFSEQKGDFLNIFRPRGYQSVRLWFHGIPLWVVGTPAFGYLSFQSVNRSVRTYHSPPALPLLVPGGQVNAHLNLGNSSCRLRQVSELLAHADTLAQSGSVFLVGDFNAVPDSTEVRMISEQAGFTDCLWQFGLGLEPTWSSRNPLTCGILIEEDHRCDYIFYKSLAGRHHIINRNSSILLNTFPWLSDHFAIMMEASLFPCFHPDTPTATATTKPSPLA